jgi:thioredoxin-dependent peroxiredoxin
VSVMNERFALALLLLTLSFAGCKTTAEQHASPSASPAVAAKGSAEQELLGPGKPAPEITGVAHNGESVKLSAFRGRPVIVYFYPKDDTPGCTVEAEGLRDDWDKFANANAVVIGVSTDDNASHRAFAEKYKLPFLLLPDADQRIANAFGVPVSLGHAKRVTFVIDKAGQIARVFPDVSPKGHAEELLSAVQGLGS